MQLSAANLLIAAQQFAKPAPQAPSGPASFAAALSAEDGFAPLDFKQTANPAPVRAAQASGPAPQIGATLDIRI